MVGFEFPHKSALEDRRPECVVRVRKGGRDRGLSADHARVVAHRRRGSTGRLHLCILEEIAAGWPAVQLANEPVEA